MINQIFSQIKGESVVEPIKKIMRSKEDILKDYGLGGDY